MSATILNTNMKLSSKDSENLVKIYEGILHEDMGSADVYGGSGFEMGIENDDFYARGDARNPYGLGITTRKGKIDPKKKKRKKSLKSRPKAK
jgi:hypothetical protein